ncbi:MAG: hypothetical protein A3I15_06160 [Chlamydiae bacterium RIFCSPLOWO2_02_FULL_49_12]|nr:MAG: hypothetical protein A3I15_06160 [Chlamydiae bacterium RIFCSPLOWO2_02_FULL_49_12]
MAGAAGTGDALRGLPPSLLSPEEIGKMAETSHCKAELPQELSQAGWVIWKTYDQFSQEKTRALQQQYANEDWMTYIWRGLWRGWEKIIPSFHYSATAFYHPHKNIGVIASKGTSDLTDLYCDIEMAKGLPPLDQRCADEFADLAGKEWAKIKNITIVHIGFSKGADHAGITAYRRGEVAYLIDPFRMETILENQFGRPLDPKKLSKFTTFLADPNLINCWRGPVGHVVRVHFSPAVQKEIEELMEKIAEAKQLERIATFGEGDLASPTAALASLNAQHTAALHNMLKISAAMRPSQLTLEIAYHPPVDKGEESLLPSRVLEGVALLNMQLEEHPPVPLFSDFPSSFFPNIQVQVDPRYIEFSFDLLNPNKLKAGQAFTSNIEDFVQRGAYIPFTAEAVIEAYERVDREILTNIVKVRKEYPDAILTYPLAYPATKHTQFNYELIAHQVDNPKNPGKPDAIFCWVLSNDSGLWKGKKYIYLIAGCTPSLARLCKTTGWSNRESDGLLYSKNPHDALAAYAAAIAARLYNQHQKEMMYESMRQAQEATLAKDYSRALVDVKKWYDVVHNDYTKDYSWDLTIWLAFLYSQLGRKEEACAVLGSMEPYDPYTIRIPSGILFEAEIFLVSGHFGEATQRFDEYFRSISSLKRPIDEERLLGLARFLFDHGQDEAAHTLLTKVNTPKARKLEAELFFKRAFQALGRKELETATNLLKQAVACDKEDLTLTLFLASVHWYKKEWREALPLIDGLLDRHPTSLPPLYLTSEILHLKIDAEPKFPSLRFINFVKSEGSKFSPVQINALFGKLGVVAFALCAYLQNNVWGAKDLLDTFPNDPKALRLRIVIAREEKDDAAIIKYTTHLISQVPKDVAAIRLLYDVYTRQYKKAKTGAEKVKLIALRALLVAIDPTYAPLRQLLV